MNRIFRFHDNGQSLTQLIKQNKKNNMATPQVYIMLNENHCIFMIFCDRIMKIVQLWSLDIGT